MSKWTNDPLKWRKLPALDTTSYHVILLRINNISPGRASSSHKRKGDSSFMSQKHQCFGAVVGAPIEWPHCTLWPVRIAPKKMPQRSKGTVSCCCPAKPVTYWGTGARNAPTKLGQWETVLPKRSSGGSKLMPSTTKWCTSNTHAVFHDAPYIYLYISKGDCWFSEAIILLPLTYFEVQKILGLVTMTTLPKKSLNSATP